MKATTVAWPLFSGGLQKQDSAALDEWLARWRFGDDGATMLVSPRATEEDATVDQRGPLPGSFSLVPLLLGDGEIPADAREALIEGRRQDAAQLLMREYDLSCNEVGDLLDVSAS